jgi:hypothetical protein
MLSEIKAQLLLSHQLQENVHYWKHSENNDLKKDNLNCESKNNFVFSKFGSNSKEHS